MVQFSECDPLATAGDVDLLEGRLGFRLPKAIRELLMTANGGRPSPSIFRSESGATNVSECLALRAGNGSIEWTYDLFVVKKKAAPVHFLPFAVDSFGNTFFVDCDSEAVFLLLHEPTFHLCDLKVQFSDFWPRLTVT